MNAQEKARGIMGLYLEAKGHVPIWNKISPEGLVVSAIAKALEEARNEALEEIAQECDERAATYREKVAAYGPVKNGDMLWPAYVANLEMAEELAEVTRALKYNNSQHRDGSCHICGSYQECGCEHEGEI